MGFAPKQGIKLKKSSFLFNSIGLHVCKHYLKGGHKNGAVGKA
jgi:hypothetical protein